MPIVNGRLVCCSCGADLGDAGDPYRDPSCLNCAQLEAEQELAAEERGGFAEITNAGRAAIATSGDRRGYVQPDWSPPEGTL